MGFNWRSASDKELLNVTNLFAGTMKDFNLPVFPMSFLKLSAGDEEAFLRIGMKIHIVFHVIVFIDCLKYFDEIKLLEVGIKPFSRNISRTNLLILARLGRNSAVFLNAEQKTQFLVS